MYKKIILNIVLLLYLTSCSAQANFIEASKEIYKDRVSRTKQYKKQEKFAHSLRKELYNNGKLDFFSSEEPLYIIEGYDLETDDTLSSIMNLKGEINFEFSSQSYKILKESIYSESLKKLIISWNVDAVKAKEKNKTLSGLDIIATKVLFNKDGSVREIKSMLFNQFDGALQIW